jgi:hypothetical protein
MNLTSLSETILLGTPWSHTISLKNKLAMLVVSSVLWHRMKCVILLNLSTITKIESLPFFVLGSPKTKSIDMSTHGPLGMGKGVYNPCGKTLDLALRHVMHLPHIRVMSLLILGQKKCLCKISKVFLTPKCPINPPPWNSIPNSCKCLGASIYRLRVQMGDCCDKYGHSPDGGPEPSGRTTVRQNF